VPADFDQIKSSLQKFTQKQESNGVKIVCVTSGGTTVPFEKNTVRFLDNFSSGNRGASCTEHFLRQGYAVVFLSRIGSATPFARKFQKLLSPSYDLKFLQYLKVQDDGHLAIEFGTEKSKEQSAAQILKEYEGVCKESRLINVPFHTLGEYLVMLKMIALEMNLIKQPPLFILAAAVSDFYIPYEELETHKIQSGSGLALELEQVPKLLGVLRKEWAPNAMVVSFKLETDHNILIKKAKDAITKYGVHLVVANELHSRYEEVFLVSSEEEEKISRGENEELESELVHVLSDRHDTFLTKHTM